MVFWMGQLDQVGQPGLGEDSSYPPASPAATDFVAATVEDMDWIPDQLNYISSK